MSSRLFAPPERRPRWTGNILPVLAEPACPRQICGAFLVTLRGVVQPALFYHGGYGGAERTVAQACPVCGWSTVVRVETVNPRKLAEVA